MFYYQLCITTKGHHIFVKPAVNINNKLATR